MWRFAEISTQKSVLDAIQFSSRMGVDRFDFRGLSQCRIIIRRPGLAERYTVPCY